MTVNLYTFIDLYRRCLDTAEHVLDKGLAYAAENGISEAEMLEWRLCGDMQPLVFQFTVVINFTRQWPARVAGIEPPASLGAGFDVAGIDVAALQAGIDDARAYLAALTPEQFAGRDDVPFTQRLGEAGDYTLPSAQWLTGFATTNIYFHMSMIYGILRAHGVPVGKRDLFASGF